MDDAHLIAAARHVENCPVAARMVERAEHWHWSSGRSCPLGILGKHAITRRNRRQKSHAPSIH
jgi:hypothetical protein